MSKGNLPGQCSNACTHLDVVYGYPFIYEVKNGSSSFFTLYFETSIVTRESQVAYDSTDLFADIGGYAGLLLGASVFDFAKIFRLFLEEIQRYRSYRKESNRINIEV